MSIDCVSSIWFCDQKFAFSDYFLPFSPQVATLMILLISSPALMPINHEMPEQVHTVFYLLYSQQNYYNALLCTRYVPFKTLRWFPICSHVLFEPIRNVMFFAFSLSCSMMFWFDKANRLSAIFFHFGVQIWRFTGVSIATSVLHSITWIPLYNLFMHSSLANQKQDILLSV